ncbi:site-specific integrase [Pedobacter nanyangensis]|uniref:site-specific integrase n=1 Tax=Pedobacter nanyangensis TaxID=1562389 RepID=UPI000DE3A8B3|nr:site-specific integrase [Pedobacter nanyangensis]
MKLTYSVRPVLRTDKKRKDGTCPIHFSVRVGQYVTRMPSGKYINEKDWDSKNNCPKKKDKFLQLLATYLNKKASGFETYMLTQESLGKPITLTVAMNYFRDNTKVNLFDFWQQQITLWEFSKEYNTLKSYKSGLNIIKQFNPKMNFGDISYDLIQRYDVFLRKVRGNQDGGCYTKHKVFKAIINEAIRKGYMDVNPYKDFPIKASKGNREFLSINEVKKLMTYEVDKSNETLTRVKDLFLFSCFTGLRYSDVMNIKLENIKDEPSRIEIKVQKTDRPLAIPLMPNARAILQKYNGYAIKPKTSSALPQMANQVVNRGLKDLMKLVGINKSISFHCARHSFASNLIENGVYISHVKDLLGHTNIAQTQIYAKSLSEDLYSSMDKLNDVYHHAI